MDFAGPHRVTRSEARILREKEYNRTIIYKSVGEQNGEQLSMNAKSSTLLIAVSVLVLTLSAQATSVNSMQTGGPGSSAGTAAVVPGDSNEDGVVNAADFITLKRNMGKPSNGLMMNGNINGISTVGFGDLQTLTVGMGIPKGSPPLPAVPEPLTMGLFALGMLAAARHVRGRLAIPR